MACGFEPRSGHHNQPSRHRLDAVFGHLAQLAEQRFHTARVPSSILGMATSHSCCRSVRSPLYGISRKVFTWVRLMHPFHASVRQHRMSFAQPPQGRLRVTLEGSTDSDSHL